jgi:hypothetical protein
VYIGRGSKWGNPYPMNGHSDAERQRVINQYRDHLWKQIESGMISKEDLISLDGYKLGCFCKPKACHGDVIVKAVAWAKG